MDASLLDVDLPDPGLPTSTLDNILEDETARGDDFPQIPTREIDQIIPQTFAHKASSLTSTPKRVRSPTDVNSPKRHKTFNVSPRPKNVTAPPTITFISILIFALNSKKALQQSFSKNKLGNYIRSKNISFNSIKECGKGFMVVLKNAHSVEKLLKETVIMDINVKYEKPRWETESKGVIKLSTRDSDDDIQDMIDCANLNNNVQITSFRRILRNQNPTPVVILTFNSPNRPDFITFGCSEKLKIAPYLKNPKQCTNCMQFNHQTNECKNEPRCKQCGSYNHSIEECTSNVACANCNVSGHSAFSNSCPKRKEISDKLNKHIIQPKISESEGKDTIGNKTIHESKTPIKSNRNARRRLIRKENKLSQINTNNSFAVLQTDVASNQNTAVKSLFKQSEPVVTPDTLPKKTTQAATAMADSDKETVKTSNQITKSKQKSQTKPKTIEEVSTEECSNIDMSDDSQEELEVPTKPTSKVRRTWRSRSPFIHHKPKYPTKLLFERTIKKVITLFTWIATQKESEINSIKKAADILGLTEMCPTEDTINKLIDNLIDQ